MSREHLVKAGRLEKILYSDERVVSIGKRGYRRIEGRPTASTVARLDALADRRFGSRPNGQNMGVVYRSPWKFLRALWRTQLLVWGVGSKRRVRKP